MGKHDQYKQQADHATYRTAHSIIPVSRPNRLGPSSGRSGQASPSCVAGSGGHAATQNNTRTIGQGRTHVRTHPKSAKRLRSTIVRAFGGGVASGCKQRTLSEDNICLHVIHNPFSQRPVSSISSCKQNETEHAASSLTSTRQQHRHQEQVNGEPTRTKHTKTKNSPPYMHTIIEKRHQKLEQKKHTHKSRSKKNIKQASKR